MATRVAVIGIGSMGRPIAQRLLEAGYPVAVWNRTPSKMKPLIELGAMAAATPKEASRDSDVVITLVSDPSALWSVVEGDEGVAAGLTGSATLIQMSTVGPAALNRLATVLPRDASLLDAPVLGSISEADSGSLLIFVSGPDAIIKRCVSLLAVLGSPMNVGPVGRGTAAKLIANLTLLGMLGLLGEALLLSDAVGLPREVAFEVLSKTPLAAQADRRRTSIETREYPSRFSLALAHKDADLIVEAASSAGKDLPIMQGARAWFAHALREGRGNHDYSAVLAHMLNDGASS